MEKTKNFQHGLFVRPENWEYIDFRECGRFEAASHPTIVGLATYESNRMKINGEVQAVFQVVWSLNERQMRPCSTLQIEEIVKRGNEL
jgi:hypothetical protein